MDYITPPPGGILPDYALAAQPDGTHATTILFPERFCGVAGVVHGGVVSMLFDEVLGSVANHAPGDWWATASLRVDYRAPSPTGEMLTAIVHHPLREGRKCTVRAELYAGDVLCAEAEGLFVKVR
jgi:acyl-coenzyme A thioesterase PaaI-like protein